MKDLYIKPEVEFKEFDILDVITTSPPSQEKPGDGSTGDEGPSKSWSDLY